MKTKAHLVIPQEILDEVDHIAGKRRRSLFIAQATKEKLDRERFIKALEDTCGIWTEDRHPNLRSSGDMEALIRKTRDSFQKRKAGNVLEFVEL
jgi:hypothetical protein